VLELGETRLPGWSGQLVAMNFLHFAILLFLLCATVLVVVSLATRPPDAARIAPLTIGGGRAPASPTRGADIALGAALAGLVAAAWLYFS
jgi:SSS family solute:Na+ symporter